MAKFTECDDYVNSIQVPQLIKTSKLQNGAPEMNGIRPIMHTGGYCVVFPYATSGKKYAVRCWHANLDGTQERTRKISEYISKLNLPYFVNFEYVEEGIATAKGVMPIVLMDWVDAKPLKTYIAQKINNPTALNDLASAFLTMAQSLHSKDVSHGDLQHGNILVKDNGSIVLVDYDSVYVPTLQGYKNEISGLKGYQHPARWTTINASAKADYFSELIIYTSIKAFVKFPNLWDELSLSDTDTLIFSGEDINSKGKSEIFEKLCIDPYLKVLVDSIRDALKLSSIEELKPLELLEPNMCKNKIVDEIKKLLSPDILNISDIEATTEWLNSIDDKTYEDVSAKLSQLEGIADRKKKIDAISKEWNNDNIKDSLVSNIKELLIPKYLTQKDIKDINDWIANIGQLSLDEVRRKYFLLKELVKNREAINNTRNEWNQ